MKQTAWQAKTFGEQQSEDSFARQTKDNYRRDLERQIDMQRRNKLEQKARLREEELLEEQRIQKDLLKIEERERSSKPGMSTRDIFAPSTAQGSTQNSFGSRRRPQVAIESQVIFVYISESCLN